METHYFFKFRITFVHEKDGPSETHTGGVFPDAEYAAAYIRRQYGHLDKMEFEVLMVEPCERIVLEHRLTRNWKL